MKLHEIVSNRQIVVVCGNISSGKGTYVKSKYPDYQQITVSDIVKKLTGMQNRSEITKTKNLDIQIIEELIKEISKYNRVVVEGIRQPSILHKLELHFGDQIKDVIWLDVPEEKRREYFTKRGASKDDMSFDKASAADRNLGIDDLEQYIRDKHRVEKL